MRAILAVLACAAVLAAAPAHAEKQIFIIVTDADGYGIDRCLAAGSACGTAAATAYCRAHEYRAAASFRKVDRDDITGAVPTRASGCRGNACDQFVAIECDR